MREIRFIDADSPALLKKALDLVRDVFWEFEAPDYEDEGIIEFSTYIQYDNIAQLLAAGQLVIMGAFEDKRLAGVLAMRPPGHISLLFVGTAYQRRGIARTLVEEMARCVAQLTDTETLTVNSSPYAVQVYQRLGFVPTGEEQTQNGILFTPMQRPLNGRPGQTGPQQEAAQ